MDKKSKNELLRKITQCGISIEELAQQSTKIYMFCGKYDDELDRHFADNDGANSFAQKSDAETGAFVSCADIS